MRVEYAELKCKTNFSFLRGASHPEELVTRAAELGLKGLALNDNDGVYGIPKAYHYSRNHPDFKLIVGADLTLKDHPSLTLLAKDRQAYGLLCRIITASHVNKPKGKACLTLPELISFMAERDSPGLIALPESSLDETSIKTPYDLLKELFNQNLYLPLSRFLDGRDKERTEKILFLSKNFDIPIVATNDVHYHIASRSKLQDALTSVRHTTSLNNAGYRLFSNGERHLKSPEAMSLLFKDMPEAIAQTVSIAEQCTFSPSELRYRYPSEWIPRNHTAQSYLEERVWAEGAERYGGTIPDAVIRQLKDELSLIAQLSYADYFLTIYEIVCYARSKKILCQGRGAAANSAVCYVLGITAIDPVKMNLLFERFMSVERSEPPDIDVDFEHERREEVIQHIYERYGRDRSAMVSAVVTYRKRSAFREMSKALGIDVGTLSAKKLERNFEKLALKTKNSGIKEQILSLAEEMKGFPRHLSIHSGGFTLSAGPIIEIVPVEPARMEGRTIIQWDKYDLDYLGLLKIDILSLGMLSALRKMLDLLGKQLHQIPSDDKPTYEMIQRADTVGTFQIESRAQMSMLGRLLPENFYDLVVQVAIVRPGPILGKMVHPYLKRRQALRRGEKLNDREVYLDIRAKPFLEKTLGVPLFQEQIMKIAVTLGGFTPGEADELRRAIGAWRAEGSIVKMGQKLVEGLKKGGLPPEFAERIFHQIQGFAQYGFPESHSASFAILAYASAYLKCHHPAEFTSSLINSQPMGFYSSHTLVTDAQRHGVEVLPVHPNISQWDCMLEGKNRFRLGFRVVTGLARKDADHLIATRQEAPYRDLGDFLSRTHLKQTVLHRLAMANAFGCFGFDERHGLWEMLEYDLLLEKSSDKQLGLFSGRRLLATSQDLFECLGSYEKIQREYDAYHLTTSGHPMGALRGEVAGMPKLTSKDLRMKKTGDIFTSAGLVLVKQRPPTAKGVTFATLEDEFGFMDLILHVEVYERYQEAFLNHCFLKVTGVVQRDTNTISLLVKHLEPLDTNLFIEPQQYFHGLQF